MSPEDQSRRRGRKSWIVVGGAFALLAAAVIAGVILAGGGDDAGGTSSTPPRLAALMDRTGCQGDIKGPDHEPFVREVVDCDTDDGSYLDIATFTTQAAEDAWISAFEGEDYLVHRGELWVVAGTEPDAVRAAAEAIG